MKKFNTVSAKLAAAALSVALVAAPAVALAQPASATVGETPVVAQSSYDYTDSALTAIGYFDYSPSEVAITDLDTYVNGDGVVVDYVGFDAYGTHYDVEASVAYDSVVAWSMYAL